MYANSLCKKRRLTETMRRNSQACGFVVEFDALADVQHLVDIERVQCDEERLLDTVKPNSQEAIVSCLSLHWVNDLPG